MPITTNNNLVTIHTFKDQDYLIRLDISSNRLELKVSDKEIGEEWRCSYDQIYIETLTTKTGNYKTFEVFTKMLISGLLKSSRAITLNLLTYEELHQFQNRTASIKSYFRNNLSEASENKKYLILGYTTEFDKTYYPITLDHCGSPDVKSLIATIRRLESDLCRTREEYASFKMHCHAIKHKAIDDMQKKIKELKIENEKLTKQIGTKSSTKVSSKAELAKTTSLENALSKLEKSVITERSNHQKYINKLLLEKNKMQQEIDAMRRKESALKQQLSQSKKSSGISSLSERQSRQSSIPRNRSQKLPNPPTSMSYERNKVLSRSSSQTSRCSRTSSGCDSIKSRSSGCANIVNANRKSRSTIIHCSSSRASQSETSSIARSENIKLKLQSTQEDYKVLEKRITGLQKLLLSKSK